MWCHLKVIMTFRSNGPRQLKYWWTMLSQKLLWYRKPVFSFHLIHWFDVQMRDEAVLHYLKHPDLFRRSQKSKYRNPISETWAHYFQLQCRHKICLLSVAYGMIYIVDVQPTYLTMSDMCLLCWCESDVWVFYELCWAIRVQYMLICTKWAS